MDIIERFLDWAMGQYGGTQVFWYGQVNLMLVGVRDSRLHDGCIWLLDRWNEVEEIWPNAQ